MTVFLDRIDAVPVASNTQFDYQFLQWLWVLVDSLNENWADVQDALNLLQAMSYTQAEIVALNGAGQLSDGVLLYDNTNNEYVGRKAGALVKFTTTSYP